jgi:O-methyltransferase domain
VLRALSGVGVFTEGDNGAFALSPLAECLRSDVPHSQRAFAIMMGEQWVWRSWGEALHSVRTGEPAFEHIYGMPLFDYYSEHPEAARVGAAGLSARSEGENAAILAAYDFAAVDSVTDVGGGAGSLLRALLSAHPHLRGVLFEMPHVVEMARTELAWPRSSNGANSWQGISSASLRPPARCWC